MDPITAIGLISSVAQLVQCSETVINLIRTFKDADRDLSDLSSDIATFAEALKCFDRVLRSKHALHRVSAPVFESVITQSRKLLLELESKLKQISSNEMTALRRARWVQHRSSIMKLHTRLKEQNAMLQTFLSITHALVSSIFTHETCV